MIVRVLAVLFPEECQTLLPALYDAIATRFGWLFIGSGAALFGFAVWLILSRHGDLKLGSDDDEPSYSDSAWLAMLFSAGIGIGLVYYGVA